MKIAHLSDIHIRFGSRHDEYRQVFQRLYEDLKKEKPDRIVVTGDLMHHKVNLSPNSIVLMIDFLMSLSEIAPTDIIAGNHDMNMKQEAQGDVISPIVFMSRYTGKDLIFLVTEENKHSIDYKKNSVYFYPNSGFYSIDEKYTYCVFSCRDEKVLELKESEKKPGVTYIALWHGALYGARMDNGYENINQASWKKSIFKNFDATLMGDFHEYQSFENDTMAYSGSLIQQNFSEGTDKGYLMWKISSDKISHQRKIIPNDWGFAKITVTRGESIEQRIDNMQFSNDRRKTKVIVVIEDFEENRSQEKELQIKQLVKDKYKCESVRVDWKTLEKDDILEDEESGEDIGESFDARFKRYIDRIEHDLNDQEVQELFAFAYQIEKELGLNKEQVRSKKFDVISMEVRNLFSFPDKPTFFSLEDMPGITGIFGENYCGKSNVIRALVFGLFESIVGTKDKSKLVNIYTNSNKGYVQVIIKIEGVKYRITREVIQKRSGGNSYPTKFEVWKEVYYESGQSQYVWDDEINDQGTAENQDIKGQIIDAIGTYEDFSIIALHANNNDSDYLSMKQQPKNDLIARYLDLSNYKMRKDHVNQSYFNPLRQKIKEGGVASDIQEEIAQRNLKCQDLKIEIQSLEEEQILTNQKVEDKNKRILELTKELLPVENLGYANKSVLENEIELQENIYDDLVAKKNELKTWLENNLRKELPFDGTKTMEGVERELQQAEYDYTHFENLRRQTDAWLQENPYQEIPDISEAHAVIQKIQNDIIECQNKIIAFQGKECPTCKTVLQQPDPISENAQKVRKQNLEQQLREEQKKIEHHNSCSSHNQLRDKKTQELELLISQSSSRKFLIETLMSDKKQLIGAQDILAMNQFITNRTQDFENVSKKTEQEREKLTILRDKLVKFDKNLKNKEKNKQTQDIIESLEEELIGHKQSITSTSLRLRNLYGELAVTQKDIQQKETQLELIKDQDKLYRKYKLYLQAVDRQGIPGMVIKTKLPLINEQIHNILQDIVTFKVDLEIDDKGNVSEVFYFMENKADSLPLGAMASASQKFIVTLAIKSAFHKVSNYAVSQPSFMMIDEGFGSLDSNHISEVQGMLMYLATKYKNVLIITHLNEVKDSVDNIIEVSKDRSFITAPEMVNNSNAGVSQFSFSISSSAASNRQYETV